LKIDPESGEVVARLTLKRTGLTRRWRVRYDRVDQSDQVDSRFDSRRSQFKLRKLHPRNIGVIYLYAAAWLLYSLWVPDTWLTWLTHRSVINQQTILLVVATGLIVPLASGVFDLSIAATMSATAVTVSWLLVDRQWAVPAAIAAAAALGLVIGAINAFLVVRIRIDSFIATLGISSVLTAFGVWRSGNRSIIGLPESFLALTTEFAFGLRTSVILAVVLAIIAWFVLEHTPVGRYFFATGGGRDAARLAGIHTDRYVAAALMVSSFVAGLAGILLASQYGSTQAQSGAPYLLPAFAAVFLGSTQFKRHFNVPGTVLAVIVLQSGVKGLQLAGVAVLWVENLFFGLALVISVGFSTFQRRVHGGQRRWWRREESGPEYLLGRLLGWGREGTRAGTDTGEWWHDPSDVGAHHHRPSRARRKRLRRYLPRWVLRKARKWS
jgi:ribose transport system permease protein